MPGLVPGIHVFLHLSKTWMAGTSPAMTKDRPFGYGRTAGVSIFMPRARDIR